MIDFIEGKVEYIGPGFIVIDTGNFGFKIEVPLSDLEKITQKGEITRLFTYLLIRERDLSIFGFLRREERDIFLDVLGVGGIGPKTGLALLSLFSPERLQEIISSEDVDSLKKVPGIGKKTAQRLILELKGSLEKRIEKREESYMNLEDVYLALISLGYSKREINIAIDKLKGKISHNMDSNKILKLVLQELDKNE